MREMYLIICCLLMAHGCSHDDAIHNSGSGGQILSGTEQGSQTDVEVLSDDADALDVELAG